ncbi:Hypothetical predicted protein [Lynx pardinus]|uniref:Large ribosomal subunit protein uL22 n=1 Tax=Lynx pardinus TaxID=191816 RepID=A0A485NAP5_LYNPA|nr:Hypothetical predicted protein [Lynx pardinus]
MVRYSLDPENPTKSCKSRGSNLRVHFKGLDVDSLVIEHIQVNKAPKMRRRTYRAHGRINPYMSSPCHIEMILTEKEQIVPKPEEEVAQKKKVNYSLLLSR